MNVVFVSINSIGSGLSGGDNIWIQLFNAWRRRMNLTLVGSEEALGMAEKKGLKSFQFVCADAVNDSVNPYSLFGLLLHNLRRIRAAFRAVKSNDELFRSADVVYTASDAYADFLTGWLVKRKYPRITWIAGYYLFIPPPWDRQTPYKGKNSLRGFCYWLMQRVSYPLINRRADHVFVTSEPDVSRFINGSRGRERVTVIRGGVDTMPSEEWLKGGSKPEGDMKYDACFIGRLHYQKGIVELISIWGLVVKIRPGARLAVIGDGPLDAEVRSLTAKKGLSANVDMLGFLDGEEKFKVFRGSRMVVHPAIYDSGGMAAAEAMAWGLPGVSFDLEALKTYYPKGMLKTAAGDKQGFADNILRLLDDRALYERVAGEALALVREQWDWARRAEEICSSVFKNAAVCGGSCARKEDV